MKITKIIIESLFMASVLISCNNNNDKADGYGNFEATETIVSSESNGKLLQFTVEEGQQLKQNQHVGLVDTIPLSLKKDQLIASKEIIRSKSKGVLSQISVLKAQLTTAMISKKRIENLLKANAGTQKQLDDIDGKVATLKQQIKSIKTQNIAVLNELKSSNAQIAQLDDQIKKSIITNPINGTVLVKYAEPNEITSFGKPLYKIANLSSLELRVYISETQLPEIKIGQKVAVKIDAAGGTKKYDGIITWIASEAEFTPKIIQTKKERVNLVYAVKVTVKNDGSLKIGMPAEMWINTNQ
jgi:HlyD family secretion protein